MNEWMKKEPIILLLCYSFNVCMVKHQHTWNLELRGGGLRSLGVVLVIIIIIFISIIIKSVISDLLRQSWEPTRFIVVTIDGNRSYSVFPWPMIHVLVRWRHGCSYESCIPVTIHISYFVISWSPAHENASFSISHWFRTQIFFLILWKISYTVFGPVSKCKTSGGLFYNHFRSFLPSYFII